MDGAGDHADPALDVRPDIDTPDRSFAWHLPVLALYGLYFAIGWSLHGARDLFPILASRWARQLVGGLAVSFVSVIGVGLRLEGGPWALANAQALRWGSAFIISVAMASSVPGWIGAFVRFCGTPSATMRYLSDASYWIYVLHLPVMTALQVWWAGSGLPCQRFLLDPLLEQQAHRSLRHGECVAR